MRFSVAAAAAVVAVVVVVLAIPTHPPSGGGPGSGSSMIGAGSADAGITAMVRADAAMVATVASDAATVAPAPDPAIAANGSDAVAPRPPALVDAAAKLYEEGVGRMKADDYEVARQRLSQAIAQDPRAHYFLSLAVADMELGHDDAAGAALREALLHAPTPDEAAGVTKLFEILSQRARRTGGRQSPPTSPAKLVASVAPAAPATPAAPKAAMSQADIAERLYEEGKDLMYGGHVSEAARKFQEAVAHVPQAKYFINLCTARVQEGKLDSALTACNAVSLNNPTVEQQARANRLIGRIREEARKQHLELPGGQ